MSFNVFQSSSHALMQGLYSTNAPALALVRAAVDAGTFTHAWVVEAINPGHVFEITNFAGMVEEKLPEVLWQGKTARSGSVGDVILASDHSRGWLVLPTGFADLDRDFVRWFETKVTQHMLMGSIL